MLTYTFGQLKNAARHALGGNPDSRISCGLIVNRALNHLVNAHTWKWRDVLATIDFTANQGDIPLPADFGEMIEIAGGAAKYTTFRMAQPNALLAIRTHGVAGTTTMVYTIGIGTQATPQSAPPRVLRVAPIPVVTLAAALNILYRKTLVPFPVSDADTSQDAYVPALPSNMHDTLYALVRAFAVSMEENPTTAEWQLAAEALKRDVTADSMAGGPVLGRPQGTLVDEYLGGGCSWRPFDQIRMPGDP